ncbi:MAG: hypothetical protein AAF616_02630 [Bacteroidota bacterium]
MINVRLIIGSLFIVSSWGLFAQDSLMQRYDELIQGSETFNQYKVIPRTSIDAFWRQVLDTLEENSKSIKSLSSIVEMQRDSLQAGSIKLGSIQSRLDESLSLNDSINFLGLALTKTAYHLIVWGIILTLAGLAILSYLVNLKNKKVTVRSKRELETLQLAFEEHKSQSRENQVKLKRELQTAINTIEEMKRVR